MPGIARGQVNNSGSSAILAAIRSVPALKDRILRIALARLRRFLSNVLPTNKDSRSSQWERNHEANSTDRARDRSVNRRRSYACSGSASVERQLQLLCLAFLRAVLQFSAPLFSGRLSWRSSLPILGPLLLLGRPLGLLALLGLALTGIGLQTQ
jgi:hypothetical protein